MLNRSPGGQHPPRHPPTVVVQPVAACSGRRGGARIRSCGSRHACRETQKSGSTMSLSASRPIRMVPAASNVATGVRSCAAASRTRLVAHPHGHIMPVLSSPRLPARTEDAGRDLRGGRRGFGGRPGGSCGTCQGSSSRYGVVSATCRGVVVSSQQSTRPARVATTTSVSVRRSGRPAAGRHSTWCRRRPGWR